MKLLVTGACGFIGSSLALELRSRIESLEVLGLDNLSRPGSEQNRQLLHRHGIRFFHGDVRNPSDLASLPAVDWVVDASANPSVLAGVSGQTSSRQLMEHNLFGTLHLLEYCKTHRAGLVLLSTSRVYSAAKLSELQVESKNGAFAPRWASTKLPGISQLGIAESFSTEAPLSLYGSAKLASEVLSLEYGLAFDFPVYINRCGVLAGAGQFGKPDQGIFSFWIHSYCQKKPLKFIGFGGSGHQVRDCFHPLDLVSLVATQLGHPQKSSGIWNVGGGMANSISLAQLSDWCAGRFGPHSILRQPESRPFDVPWLVLDSSRAVAEWGWRPTIPANEIFEKIALHAEQHPEWLQLSGGA